VDQASTVHACGEETLMPALLIFSAPSSDPVVPILFALVFLTLGAAIGGRVMAWLKQPAVLGELLVGLLAGNLGYYFGNAGLTVLCAGDNLRKISDLALTTTSSLIQAVYQVLPAVEAERVATALGSARARDARWRARSLAFGDSYPRLARSGGEASRDVVVHIGGERFVDTLGHRAGCAGKFVSRDLSDANDVPIGGRDENFIGGVEIFEAQGLLFHDRSGFSGDFQKNAACDAFEAPGV